VPNSVLAGTGRVKRIGPYEVQRFIAQGGMAEIYLATRRWSGGITKRFAVKRLLNRFVGVSDLVQLFQDEAQLGSVLHHSNIVEVVDYGIDAAVPYMALEYVDGPNLTQVLRNTRQGEHRFGIDTALFIALEIATALEYAHNATDRRGRPLKVVHRDLSPNNVLVTANGQVKVTDFGVARFRGRRTRTHPGAVRGTMAYIAPEQAIGREVDHRADVFSLGVLLYEMVTNMHPYCGVTDFELIQEMLEGNPPPPSDFRPDIPDQLNAIVARCLMPDASSRYASASALRLALASLLSVRKVADGNALLRHEMGVLYPSLGAPDHRPWHQNEKEAAERATLWTPISHPTQEATVDRGGPPQTALVTEVPSDHGRALNEQGQRDSVNESPSWDTSTRPGVAVDAGVHAWGLTVVPVSVLSFILLAGAALLYLGSPGGPTSFESSPQTSRPPASSGVHQPEALGVNLLSGGPPAAGMNGAYRTVMVRSDPDGAVFSIGGTEMGTSPYRLQAPEGQLVQLVASLPCHRPTTRWVRLEQGVEDMVFVLQPDRRMEGCP